MFNTSTSTTTQMFDFIVDPVFWLSFLLAIIGLALLIILVRLGFKKFVVYVKQASYEKKSLKSVVFEVRVPKNSEVDATAADQMFSALMGINSSDKSAKGLKKLVKANSFVSFEIVAMYSLIKFYVIATKNIANTVEKAINGAYPSAEIIVTDEYNIFTKGAHMEYMQLKHDKDAYKPIRTYEELSTDSIATILATMSKMGPKEALVYQLILTGNDGEWRNKGKKYVSSIREAFMDTEKKSKPKVSEDVLAAIEKKCEKGGFNVDIRFMAVAPEAENAKGLLESIFAVFSQFKKEGGNTFKKGSLKFSELNFVKNFIYRIPDESLVLNTAELASVFHFPNNKVDVPNINWLMAKRAPASGEIPTTGDLFLGMNIYRDVMKPIYINRDDRRRHMYLIGKTGAGKSYLLQSMALQDMINGEGLAFLDPHGDSAEWLLERVPAHRLEDVIYWNPADADRPIGFNIIEYYNEQDKHRVVNSFLGLMTKMYDPHNQGITGPRFERSVRNSMLTVMEEQGATLVEVLRILSDPKYAEKKIPFIKDDLVRRYWTDEIANTQEFHKSEVLGYIVSKFDRFITNKLTRNIFGQSKSGFDMRWIMDNKKILIVNLSKGLIGEENAQFLGLLLVPRILSAAMSRADIAERDRKDFYLYVDEFQNFATDDFAQILSEARKYKLNLIVGNQFISQINENIRDAVFGNVGTAITMKVGSTDASFLESIYTPVFNSTDLVNLENTNAYVKIINKGETPPAFSINTHYKHSPFTIPAEGDARTAEIVKTLSRYRFGRDRGMVEAEIVNRSELSDTPSAKSGTAPLGLKR